MEKDINPVGAKLHALQMALTNKQMVEMVHQMEDPKSFLDANYIPMAAHERSGGLANVILVKINGVSGGGHGGCQPSSFGVARDWFNIAMASSCVSTMVSTSWRLVIFRMWAAFCGRLQTTRAPPVATQS